MIDDKNDMDERSREFLKDRFGSTKNLDLLNRFSQYETNPEPYEQWILRHFPIQPHDTILEIGCGNGQFWNEIADQLPVDLHLFLTDVSPAMVLAAGKAMADHHRAGFFVDGAESLCFKNACFNTVFANNVLHIVPDISTALSEIHRVLKPGGRLIFSVMSNEHMGELGVALAELNPKFEYPTGGLRRLSLECEKPELSACFTEIREYTYIDHLKVTDPDLIVDTALSIFNGIKYPELRPYAGEFKQIVLSIMEKDNGAFHLTTKYGLYTCQ